MHTGDARNDLSDAEARAVALDWTSICREIVAAMELVFERYPTFADRDVHVGRGAGGDNTLLIDKAAEDAVFAALERAAAEHGVTFSVLSEERGSVRIGAGDGVHVIVDPIDGSLNAKRVGMAYSLSLAVATGETMADVVYGFVHDFGSGEQWTARLGEGAWLGDRRLDPGEAGNGLEVVGLESAKPAFLTPELLAAFDGSVARLRSVGSIALTLCQVAAARFDGMLSLRPCRSVDAAAGQLIVREAGGHVIFGDAERPLAAPLDLAPYKPVVAARDETRARFLVDLLSV
jgi:myo-inositol-1(or 4)-monophosphatase